MAPEFSSHTSLGHLVCDALSPLQYAILDTTLTECYAGDEHEAVSIRRAIATSIIQAFSKKSYHPISSSALARALRKEATQTYGPQEHSEVAAALRGLAHVLQMTPEFESLENRPEYRYELFAETHDLPEEKEEVERSLWNQAVHNYEL